MDLNLKGRIALITGGAKGIGASCVEAFAAEGAVPVIAGRSPEVGQAIIDRLGCGMMIEAELESEEACREVVKKTLAKYGRLDGIVHNAGVNDGVSLRHGPEDFMGSLRKNIFHVFALTHFGLEALIEAKGFVVNVGSKVAETGQGGTSGYAASKGSMNALTREWALDLARHGVRVNAVIPAEVFTPQYKKWVDTLKNSQEFLEQVQARIPLGHRMTTSEEIANMVVFLASDRSAHTTGQLLYPDGGYVHLDRSYGSAHKA